MLDHLTSMDVANLAGVAAVWLMGLVFLAMNAIALCRYLRDGR